MIRLLFGYIYVYINDSGWDSVELSDMQAIIFTKSKIVNKFPTLNIQCYYIAMSIINIIKKLINLGATVACEQHCIYTANINFLLFKAIVAAKQHI